MLPKRKRRVHKQEIGWNDRPVLSDSSNAKMMSYSHVEDLKNILQETVPQVSRSAAYSSSMPVDSHNSRKVSPSKLQLSGESKTAFDSIAQTFGFTHHEGSDRVLELKVLRSILIREGLLARISESCELINSGKDISYFQSGKSSTLLDMLSQMRDQTCNLVLLIAEWRTSMPNIESEMPRPFMWRGQNYLLKAISDLDFLAKIRPLVIALGVSTSKMVVNPLMLPNSLSELDSRSRPTKLAARDTNGITEGALFEKRLRLRKAERLLLQECEFNMHGIPTIDWDEDYKNFINESPNGHHDNNWTNDETTIDDITTHKQNILNWNIEANIQLQRLGKNLGEKLSSQSTQRMDVPNSIADDPLRLRPKYAYSLPDLINPVKLTALNSDMCTIDNSKELLLSLSVASTSPTAGSLSLRKRMGLPETKGSGGGRGGGAHDRNGHGNGNVDEEGYEGGQLDGNDDDDDGSSPRDDSRDGVEEILPEDVEMIVDVTEPPEALRLSCASILVLLSKNPQSDLGWEGFQEYVSRSDLSREMNSLQPSDIDVIKLEGIRPTVKILQSMHLYDSQPQQEQEVEVVVIPLSFETESAAMKFINWVITVTINAIKYHSMPTTHKKNSHQLNGKPYSKSTTNDNNNKAGNKKGLIPSFNQKIQRERVHHSDLEMDVKLTELMENIFERALVVVLYASRTSPPDRYVLSVYDPSTSKEARTPINVREYQIFKKDMEHKFEYHPEVSTMFHPASTAWWKGNLMKIMRVSAHEGSSIKVRISKKAIEKIMGSVIKNNNTGSSTSAQEQQQQSKAKATKKSSNKKDSDTDNKPETEKDSDPLASSESWTFHTEQNVQLEENEEEGDGGGEVVVGVKSLKTKSKSKSMGTAPTAPTTVYGEQTAPSNIPEKNSITKQQQQQQYNKPIKQISKLDVKKPIATANQNQNRSQKPLMTNNNSNSNNKTNNFAKVVVKASIRKKQDDDDKEDLIHPHIHALPISPHAKKMITLFAGHAKDEVKEKHDGEAVAEAVVRPKSKQQSQSQSERSKSQSSMNSASEVSYTDDFSKISSEFDKGTNNEDDDDADDKSLEKVVKVEQLSSTKVKDKENNIVNKYTTTVAAGSSAVEDAAESNSVVYSEGFDAKDNKEHQQPLAAAVVLAPSESVVKDTVTPVAAVLVASPSSSLSSSLLSVNKQSVTPNVDMIIPTAVKTDSDSNNAIEHSNSIKHVDLESNPQSPERSINDYLFDGDQNFPTEPSLTLTEGSEFSRQFNTFEVQHAHSIDKLHKVNDSLNSNSNNNNNNMESSSSLVEGEGDERDADGDNDGDKVSHNGTSSDKQETGSSLYSGSALSNDILNFHPTPPAPYSTPKVEVEVKKDAVSVPVVVEEGKKDAVVVAVASDDDVDADLEDGDGYEDEDFDGDSTPAKDKETNNGNSNGNGNDVKVESEGNGDDDDDEYFDDDFDGNSVSVSVSTKEPVKPNVKTTNDNEKSTKEKDSYDSDFDETSVSASASNSNNTNNEKKTAAQNKDNDDDGYGDGDDDGDDSVPTNGKSDDISADMAYLFDDDNNNNGSSSGGGGGGGDSDDDKYDETFDD
eukprot:gene9549-19848_t